MRAFITEEDQLFDYYGVPLECVVPSVAHLGTALGTDDSGDLTKTRVDHGTALPAAPGPHSNLAVTGWAVRKPMQVLVGYRPPP